MIDNCFPIRDIMFFSSNNNNTNDSGNIDDSNNSNNPPGASAGDHNASNSSQGQEIDNNMIQGSAMMSGATMSNLNATMGNNMGVMGLQQQMMQGMPQQQQHMQQQQQMQQQQPFVQQQQMSTSLESQGDNSGYPLLLQEYLRQQQLQQIQQQQLQQQQQDNSSALGGGTGLGPMVSSSSSSFDNKMGSLAGLSSGMGSPSGGNPALQSNFVGGFGAGVGAQAANLGNNSFGQAGNFGAGPSNWSTAGPPSVSGTQTSSTSDLSLSTSDRLILQRLQQQQQQQQQQQGGASNASFLAAAAAAPANSAPGVSRDPYAEQGILGPWSERSAGLLGKMVCSDPTGAPAGGKVKRARRKQPKDKPRRPLSAYNIFFKEERARLLAKAEDDRQTKRTANGKIGFENLAKIIGSKWQDLKPSEVEYYKAKAGEDMQRYKKEMEEYNKKQKATSTGKTSPSAASANTSDEEQGEDDLDEADETDAKRQKTA